MKKSVTFLMVMLMITSFSLQALTPNDSPRKGGNNDWEKYMTPNNVHKMLKGYDGEWMEEITMWMDPNEAPVKMKIDCSIEMVLDGRYQVSKHKGDMLDFEYEGVSYLGYNTISETFSLSSFNNMGTGVLTLQGGWKTPSKCIELRGTTTSPESKKNINVRQVITFIDNDHFTIESFDTKAGENEQKSFEYKYTRKKQGSL
jgi:hypothetical protein